MKYFGTDGFRGRANDTLRLEHAIKIGQYLGSYFIKTNNRAKILIGKDTRRSSYMFEYGIAAGITSSGADAYLMHVSTTPSVSYVTKTDGFDCGVMITASHNPYYDNGIKIINSNGDKMSDDFLKGVEDSIDGIISISAADEPGKCIDYNSGQNKYITHLSSIPNNSFREYRIGIDCANGASFAQARNIFSMLGADVHILNNKPDGKNINVDCGSTHPERLQKYVVENKLDVGFAFDGDADRCVMVDEKGNLIDGDGIIYILAKYMKENGKLAKDTAVVTIMSNMGLINALKSHGIKTIQTDVGDKYVAKEMFDNGYSIGGEQSGHIIISEYSTTGDGILTALLITDMLISTKNLASAITSGFTKYPQMLENIKVEDKQKVMKDTVITETVAQYNKELGENGRVLLRASGTESLIRVMVEAKDIQICQEYIDKAKELLSFMP